MMGFKQVKAEVIDCLISGRVRHEERGDINIKNLLSTGAVTPEEVASLIGKARGGDYECSPHHFDRKIPVHTVTVSHGEVAWYIKWYFLGGCRTIHDPAANPADWPISQLLFDQ